MISQLTLQMLRVLGCQCLTLEVKKVEIASSLLTPEVETNEIEGIETEVDGSSDAVEADVSAASAE